MRSTALLALFLFAALGCGRAEAPAPAPDTLEAALLQEFDARSVTVSLVTPPRHLEIVLEADRFADAGQLELVDLAEVVARFVAERLVEGAEIERIAVELVIERTEVGPLFNSQSLRGEFPLSAL